MRRRTLAILGVLLLAISAVAGTWTSNSFIYKPSTGARGEGEKKTFDSGMDRVDARLGKEIWVGDPAYGTTLAAAVTAIGGNQAILRIPAGTWSIGANLAIPANVTVKPERGAILSIATGVTLTINGGFEAGAYQCLSRTGTGKVSFGAGSVQEVKVVWFGTNTDAITHAFSAVPSGADLRFNAGYSYTFSPSSTVVITGKSINIVCDPGVVIDATASTTLPSVLQLQGTVGTYYALGGNISKGDRTFTANSTLAASLSEGDLVKFTTDNTVCGSGELWSSRGTSYWKGEIAEVLSVAGTTVTLKGALCDNYTAGNTVTAKISPIKGSLRNFVMKGALGIRHTGIRIDYSKDYFIKDCEIHGFGYICLYFNYGYNILVDHYSASNFAGGYGVDYGLAFDSCHIARAVNCNIVGGRHAITTGGWEPNRFITIGPGNTLENASGQTVPALNLHDNNEDIIITSNHVKNGIGLYGQRIEASNNVVTIGSALMGINVGINENYEYIRIINNRIYCPPAFGTGGVAGIYISNAVSGVLRTLDIIGNEIKGSCKGIEILRTNSGGSCSINSINIVNNTSDLDYVSGSAGYPVYLYGYDASNRLIIGSCNIKNNSFRYVGSRGIFTLYATISDMSINNNTLFYDNNAAGGIPVCLKDNTTINRLEVCRNKNINTSAMSYYWINAGSDYLSFTDNILNNFSAYGGVYLIAANILFRDNYQQRCIDNVALVGRYFSKITGNGNVESWGTAAPTTGAWKKGDIIKNTSAAAGGAPGWVCTTTGTFGPATDNTGNTDGSTSTITGMTDTSAFNVGDWVNVSAGFATTGPFKIISKTATSVTVDTNSNSVHSGVTVDTSDPTFKAMANLAS